MGAVFVAIAACTPTPTSRPPNVPKPVPAPLEIGRVLRPAASYPISDTTVVDDWTSGNNCYLHASSPQVPSVVTGAAYYKANMYKATYQAFLAPLSGMCRVNSTVLVPRPVLNSQVVRYVMGRTPSVSRHFTFLAAVAEYNGTWLASVRHFVPSHGLAYPGPQCAVHHNSVLTSVGAIDEFTLATYTGIADPPPGPNGIIQCPNGAIIAVPDKVWSVLR